MPRFKSRRLWWEPVVVDDLVGYEVYASKDQAVFDPATFDWENTPGIVMKSFLPDVNEVYIPNRPKGVTTGAEWPEFPLEKASWFIGISALDQMGNKSDPLLLSAPFDFDAPPAPASGGID